MLKQFAMTVFLAMTFDLTFLRPVRFAGLDRPSQHTNLQDTFFQPFW